MCGRMNIHDHKGIQELLDSFGLSLQPDRFTARHNVAPGAELFAVFGDDGPQLAEMEWGIVPPWAKPGKFSGPLINARSETIWEKPSFKKQVASTRAIIPVNGFYEWKRAGDTKQPYLIRMADGSPMTFAGLWEPWTDPDAGDIVSCTILTTEANPFMAEIHNRMPVVLSPNQFRAWLDDADRDVLAPCADELLAAHKVDKAVGNVRNNSAELLEAVD